MRQDDVASHSVGSVSSPEAAGRLSLSHWSPHPVSHVLPVVPEAMLSKYKPAGLWVSVDGEHDWDWWCRSEGTGWTETAIRHRVRLAPSAAILRLSSVNDIDAFHREYRTARGDKLYPETGIDWPEVARAYDGIIIAPYQWERRLNGDASDWYYGWDCASGCIWAPPAIDAIEAARNASEDTQHPQDATTTTRTGQ